MAVKLPPNHNYCDFTSQFPLMSHNGLNIYEMALILLQAVERSFAQAYQDTLT